MPLFRFPAALLIVTGLGLPTCLSATPLKAVTWNLEWFPGGRPYAKKAERKTHAALVAPVLAGIKPDVFLAQEVTSSKAFANLITVVPGLKVDVVSNFLNIEGKPGSQQCAIASNLLANSAFFGTFKPSENFPNLRRGFAFAALEHPEGGLIMVYSVHLKSNRGSETPEGERDVAETRAEAVRQLIAHKAAMEKQFTEHKILGWLIAGDFNTNADGQFPMCKAVATLRSAGFHDSWDSTPKDKRFTWHPTPGDDRFKPTTFDHAMTMGFAKKQAVAIRVPRNTSDHDPVMLMIEKE